MIRGRFGNTSSAPFLEGHVSFPRLGVSGLISFLVDTGADSTIFMPADGTKLNVDYKALINPTSSDGIGGSAEEFQELAILSFADGRHVYSYLLRQAAISQPTAYNARYPSLLGRDVLNRWRFVMDRKRDKVLFTPLEWDFKRRV